jgi:hypothetical protein
MECTKAKQERANSNSGQAPLPEGDNQCPMSILGAWCASDMVWSQTCALDACKHAWDHSEWFGHLKHDSTFVRDG